MDRGAWWAAVQQGHTTSDTIEVLACTHGKQGIKDADNQETEFGLMLLNRGAGEDSWESLGQQGDQTSPT